MYPRGLMVTVWAVLLHILFASAAVAADFSSKVVRVLDGDTIEVLHNQHLKTYISNASELAY